jgi:hypothetical protein
MNDIHTIAAQLTAPFAANELHWKPQAVSGNRALAVAFIDARSVMDRLDAVLGVDGWQDQYDLLPDGSAVCKLRCRIGDHWIVKSDVGSPSEQPDEGDRRKAAFSDALKRAAVKLGIGRYLYRLPRQWTDYDPQKRQFVKMPQLPTWALPKPPAPANPASAKPAPVPALSRNGTAKSPALDDSGVNLGRLPPRADGYDDCPF